MLKKLSAMLLIFAVSACGGGSDGYGDHGGGVTSSGQQLVSSFLDQSKYVGSWSSCTPLPNGQFYGNNMTFTAGSGDLIFVPAIGIVGNYTDAACTQGVPGGLIGITPIVGIHFVPAITISITSQAGAAYYGTADSLPDMRLDAFKFIAFSPDYRTMYASPNSAFDTVVVYNRR